MRPSVPHGPRKRVRFPEPNTAGTSSQLENSSCHLFPDFCVSSKASPNDFIRPRQHVRRNRHADLLRGLKIDDQLELRWLLDWNVGRFRSLENLVDEARGVAAFGCELSPNACCLKPPARR